MKLRASAITGTVAWTRAGTMKSARRWSSSRRTWVAAAPRRTAYQAFQVPEKAGAMRVVSRRFVRAAARAGVPVAVWTVDEPAAMERLLGWGVRGLISDRPDLAVPLVRRWRARQ